MLGTCPYQQLQSNCSFRIIIHYFWKYGGMVQNKIYKYTNVLCIYLFTHLYIYLFICIFIISLFMHLFIYTFINHSITCCSRGQVDTITIITKYYYFSSIMFMLHKAKKTVFALKLMQKHCLPRRLLHARIDYWFLPQNGNQTCVLDIQYA